MVATLLVAWVAVQLTLPLRHLAIPGSPSWTEQGHRFAWHMKLRDKAGTLTYVLDDGDRTWRVDSADDLSPTQLYRVPGHPERLVHLAARPQPGRRSPTTSTNRSRAAEATSTTCRGTLAQ